MKYALLLLPSLVFHQLVTAAAIDMNSNGVSDIWEHKYDATSLVLNAVGKQADTDGDGQTNFEESLAGTDPRDSNSRNSVQNFAKANQQITIDAATEKGKSYQIAISNSLAANSWTDHGAPIKATGDSIVTQIENQTGERVFYRFTAVDTDTDGDGVNDWEEEQLAGFDPARNDSYSSGTVNNDLAAVQALLLALQNNEVSIAATIDTAYEKEGVAAKFTITRSGATTYPLPLYLHYSGATDVTKGSASASDYILKTAANVVVSDTVTIPAGSSSVEILCTPLADALVEVPESLSCGIGGTSSAATIRLCDAQNTSENNRLFVSQMSPEAGAVSSGSGLSSILVRGDNTVGKMNLTFYGLTTPQTAVHVHIKNPISGPHVESLPMGQVNEHEWNIRAAHFLITDQAVLDALFAGKLYVNVHSSNYPTGEIRGDYYLTTGNTSFVAPPAVAAVSPLTGDALDRDIARFLSQATFGPTPDLISELRSLIQSAPHNGNQTSAYEAWIDAQLALASPDLEPYIHAADAQQRYLTSIVGSPGFKEDTQPRSTNRRRGWWLLARHAPDQVRQRLAFTLSEIFVTSENENVVDTRHYGHASYYDMLKNQGTGSYRDLLEDVSTHPIMAQYLSLLRNSKAVLNSEGEVIVSPDENFAREIMQLFSIGLVQLHPDGSIKLDSAGLPISTYGQDDISELSRVFTGWSFSEINSPTKSDIAVENMHFNYGNGSRYHEEQWRKRLKNFADYHDTDAKSCPLLGLDISAGGDGESDLDAAIDYLAGHSNTPAFISRRMIQRLITSNPSAGYIHRMTQVWGSSNGNLGAVYKAILLDPEARSLSATAASGFGKKKEPLIHMVALMRALGAQSKLPISDLAPVNTTVADLSTWAYSPSNYARFTADIAKFPVGTTRVRVSSTDSYLGQTPLASPTVFNWFLPDYSIAGPIANAGLKAPEFQIANEISVITNINYHYSLIFSSKGLGVSRLPNQEAVDLNGAPDPIFNPYLYAEKDDHILADMTGVSEMGKAYLAVMDTNGDGKVSSADTTFDDRAKVVEACVALVDHLDLLLCTGRLKSEYSADFAADVVRSDNPRDIFINAVARYATYWDDNDNDEDQAKLLNGRLKQAAYLITSSPQALIQK